MVFLSETAMELCNIALGDDVILYGKNVAVKTAFPSNERSAISLSLTKTGTNIKY